MFSCRGAFLILAFFSFEHAESFVTAPRSFVSSKAFAPVKSSLSAVSTLYSEEEYLAEVAERSIAEGYRKEHDDDDDDDEGRKGVEEYGALCPGSVVGIQVGDTNLARKAWKKRRRSGSPLLVPCSILRIDRESMVIRNVQYLLWKYGKTIADSRQLAVRPLGYKASLHICISMSEINQKYRKLMGSSLSKHALAMGYETSRHLVETMVQKSLLPDIQTYETSDGRLWLLSRLSRMKAQRLAAESGLAQFSIDDENVEFMKHTGVARVRRATKTTAVATPSDENGGGGSSDGPRWRHPYEDLPLSAAIRVSQREVDTGEVGEGTMIPAVILSYVPAGDGGLPLLKVSPHREQNFRSSRFSSSSSTSKPPRRRKRNKAAKHAPPPGGAERALNLNFSELRPGDGPIAGTVVQVLARSRVALIDIGVGRKKTKEDDEEGRASDQSVTRVLGMLRFDRYKRMGREVGFIVDFGGTNLDDPREHLLDQALDSLEYDEDGDFEAKEEEQQQEEEQENINEVGCTGEDSEVDIQKDIDELFSENSIVTNNAFEDEEEQEEGDDEETEVIEDDETGRVYLEDGVLSYKNPETGETVILGDLDDSDDDGFQILSAQERLQKLPDLMGLESSDEEVKDAAAQESDGWMGVNGDDYSMEDDRDDEAYLFPGLSAEERREKMADLMDDSRNGEIDRSGEHPRGRRLLRVGDDVEVYVQAVAKQSGRLLVTVNPVTTSMRELKRESEAGKKLDRLVAKMGGDISNILRLEGEECEGFVKATSKTENDMCYVQPDFEDLPIGVARIAENVEGLQRGDAVRIRLEGIDKERGQLAMRVLEKL